MYHDTTDMNKNQKHTQNKRIYFTRIHAYLQSYIKCTRMDAYEWRLVVRGEIETRKEHCTDQ